MEFASLVTKWRRNSATTLGSRTIVTAWGYKRIVLILVYSKPSFHWRYQRHLGSLLATWRTMLLLCLWFLKLVVSTFTPAIYVHGIDWKEKSTKSPTLRYWMFFSQLLQYWQNWWWLLLFIKTMQGIFLQEEEKTTRRSVVFSSWLNNYFHFC